MEFWIARDKDDSLFLYDSIPHKTEYYEFRSYGNYYKIDDSLFLEVTWENSPRKVKIELV